MIRLLIRSVVFLGSSAIGLWVASLLLPDLHLSAGGFIVTVIVFSIAQSVLAPFIMKVTARNAPAFLGGIGLVSTFVALLIASLFPGGLSISGWQTWVLASLVVWLATALATMVLPFLLVRDAAERARQRRDAQRRII